MTKAEIIKSEAEELLNKIGIKFKLEIIQEKDIYQVQINTEEDAPLLIGKYGETLSSIQRVLETMLFKKINEKTDIVVNVNDYRDKQKERLEEIAQREAEKVISSGEKSGLYSFSAFERKVIHEYIAKNHPDLTSYSEDEGANRQLIIAKK